MSRHAYPTMPDDRSHDTSRPVDPHELADWDETTDREFASDAPALAEAEHQVLADDDLDDDDDDIEDLDDAPDEEEDGAGDEDDDEDDFDDDDEEDDEEEDDEGDEK